MKRVAIFQNDLSVGGIQKSLINLLRNIDYNRFSVDLYLFAENTFWNVAFPEKLNVKYLHPVSKVYSFLPFNLAKGLIHPDFGDCGEYDIAIDFNSYQNSCAVGAIKIPAKKRVMWIHNDVEIKLQNEWKYRLLWSLFKGKFAYYDEFVGVSEGLIKPFQKMSGVTDKKFRAIQNYIDTTEIARKVLEEPENFAVDPNCFNLVGLGRLCHQKAYDIMLDIFARALARREDLRLYIIGDGPDREMLQEKIKNLSLTGKVFLLGNQSNPFGYMQKMDAFISTSRYEGQPLNIMEAMAVGLPLYCTKNLEKYTQGLVGYENLEDALVQAQKTEKQPDDLADYNQEITDNITDLIEH
ncbi:MAG: glycosyltransferase [Clostridiales bacterium]|jgi:glycosyltransferase involved in cell wall biosynthesis|nr:glycosyltransferase [Clostridiales bacterium]